MNLKILCESVVSWKVSPKGQTYFPVKYLHNYNYTSYNYKHTHTNKDNEMVGDVCCEDYVTLDLFSIVINLKIYMYVNINKIFKISNVFI